MQIGIAPSSIKPRLLSSPSALSFPNSHLFAGGSLWTLSFSSYFCPHPKAQRRAVFSIANATSHLGNVKRQSIQSRLVSRRGAISPGKKMFLPDGVVTQAHRGLLAELQNIREEQNAAGPLEFETPLNIVLYPDPRLRAKNKRIQVFDEKLEKLAKEMFDIMYRTDGVGLSAPQVGVNVQLMVYNPEGERGKGEEIVLVNPKIYKYANKRYIFTEGCLSFPQIEADVERPQSVRIEAQNIKGKKFSIQLKDFQARIFQHEYDHLQAVLFFERMTTEVLDTITPALEKLEEDYEKRTGLPSPERIRNQKQR